MTKVHNYFGVSFLVSKYSALDGHTTVCFEEQSGEDKAFKVMVNQSGLWFTGTLHKKISNQAELQDFAKLISVAWTEHEKLAPKLTKTLSGH